MNGRPLVVCLCGSTRFGEAFRKAMLEETLAGNIVLTIGCNMHSDDEIFSHLPEHEKAAIKARLDELHLRKIDLSDEILVLNVAGYVGESTSREIAYARDHNKPVRWLESDSPTPRCTQAGTAEPMAWEAAMQVTEDTSAYMDCEALEQHWAQLRPRERNQGDMTDEELDAKVLQVVKENHIWLNAFSCIRPTVCFKIALANMILRWLESKEHLLPSGTDELGALTPMLYLSINKS